MKKTILLILCSLGVSLIHAQIKLDSVINPGERKTVYFYDNEGQSNESIGYQWLETESRWELQSRFLRTGTTENFITTFYYWNTVLQEWTPTTQTRASVPSDFESYEWDAATGDWVGTAKEYIINTAEGFEWFFDSWNPFTQSWSYYSKTTYLTDQSDNVIEQISYRWINNAWELRGRRQFSYDAEGRITEEVSAFWNVNTSSWQNESKATSAYTPLGLKTDYAQYQWEADENVWKGIWRTTSTYEDSLRLSEAQYYWVNNSWKGNLQYLYAYNPDSTLAEIDYYSFDADLENWVYERPHRRYLYAYSPEGKPIEFIEMRWYGSINAIENYSKINYNYDQAGNIIESASWRWNVFFENWYGEHREVNEYDLSVDVEDVIYPYYNALFESGKLTFNQIYSLNGEFNDWQLDSENYYYYSELITATQDAPAAESLKLFPNPVSNLLTLGANAPRASSYQITDLDGRILQQEKTWNGEGIDVSRLIPGSYVIRLIEGNRVITGKFIKS